MNIARDSVSFGPLVWRQRVGINGLTSMAIYHFHAKMVRRNLGQSTVAAAAYRSGSKLYENATGITHDYTHKRGVEHSEILAPADAPTWVFERHTLWNTVEASEKRKDAQLAREIEVGLPIELKDREQVALLRYPTTPQLAPRLGRSHQRTPDRSRLRRPHRSPLLPRAKARPDPGVKIGIGKERQNTLDLPGFLADRVAEQQRIMGANGKEIIADPTIALKALSHSNATFSHQDIARFLNTRTQDAEQFQTALLKVTTSPDLVPLGTDDLGRQRFTTREMFNLERSLLNNADALAHRANHAVDLGLRTRILAKHSLSPEQQRAAIDITASGDLKSLAGVAGSGKSTTLKALREVWEKEGYTVKGAALAGIAVDNLQQSSGIKSRTLASYELAWNGGRDQLTKRDILVIDEAGMLGTRQLEHVLRVAEKAHAKVLLVGDTEQLQAIEAGAAFRGVTSTHGVSNLTEVRRQKLDWQRTATQDLSVGKTTEALNAYHQHHNIIAVETRDHARKALIARWAHDHKQNPNTSQPVMAFTRDDVKALNHDIRALREQTGELGKSHSITTETGKNPFATNDRIRFMRSERDLGVKNGSLGIIEGIEHGVLSVKLDGTNTRVHGDTKFYKHLDYGYAATVHKAQGTTVDRSYVLASTHFDRHTAYVALSRHRDNANVFYARDDFGGRHPKATPDSVRDRFMETLSRARPKELAHDYLERETGSDTSLVSNLVVNQWEKERNANVKAPTSLHLPTDDLDAKQQAAAERWAARQNKTPSSEKGASRTPEPTIINPDLEAKRDLSHDLGGPEDDL